MRNPTKSSPVQKPDLKLVTVRLPVDTYAKVVDLAEAQRRSIHGQLVWAVEQHIEGEATG